jgi:hypothetical protein
VRDNASGIPLEGLGDAISPGAKSGGTTLNEHGLGMKQAIASLGTLDYLLTKTKSDEMAHKVTKFDWGNLPVEEVKVDWESGTEISVRNLKPPVDFRLMNYTRTYVKKLGARYRRFLRSDNPKMRLLIQYTNVDNPKSEPTQWEVREVKPVYFHPNTRSNAPVVERKHFKGDGWEAFLTFGYAPTDAELEELGLESDKYSPYHVSISNQGLDVIKNDRIINFHQLSEINLVVTRHSDYNLVRGELDLRSGFATAITKNSLIYDKNLQEMIEKVKDFLEKGNYLKRKTWPKEIPENILRHRLARHLKTRAVDPKKDVKEEYAVGGLGGSIDLLVDGVAYEIKTVQADGLMVYQLFAYMDMGEIETGIFIAPSYSTGAQTAAEFIVKKHKKKIILAKIEEFPISYPLTKGEE